MNHLVEAFNKAREELKSAFYTERGGWGSARVVCRSCNSSMPDPAPHWYEAPCEHLALLGEKRGAVRAAQDAIVEEEARKRWYQRNPIPSGMKTLTWAELLSCGSFRPASDLPYDPNPWKHVVDEIPGRYTGASKVYKTDSRVRVCHDVYPFGPRGFVLKCSGRGPHRGSSRGWCYCGASVAYVVPLGMPWDLGVAVATLFLLGSSTRFSGQYAKERRRVYHNICTCELGDWQVSDPWRDATLVGELYGVPPCPELMERMKKEFHSAQAQHLEARAREDEYKDAEWSEHCAYQRRLEEMLPPNPNPPEKKVLYYYANGQPYWDTERTPETRGRPQSFWWE